MAFDNYVEKDLTGIFHTGLRNVGLFISISLTLLAVSRVYREKNDASYNVAFIMFSIVFNSFSIYMAYLLNKDMASFLERLDKKKESKLQKWIIIPKVIMVANIGILCFTMFTLYRQLNIRRRFH